MFLFPDVKGDIRLAFEGTTSLGPSSKKKKGATNSAKKAKSKNLEDGSTLASIGGKDPSLDLFHAMGKVLYCKREETDLVTNVFFRLEMVVLLLNVECVI